MPDPKTEAYEAGLEESFPGHKQQIARAKYEALLRDVIDEVHKLLEQAKAHNGAIPDDSNVHALVRELQDNFGPEVPR